jgi:voltage-gated potassium channel
MTGGRTGPSGHPARRALVVATLSSAAAVALLLVVYYAAPLDRPLDLWTGIMFASGLAVYGWLVVSQVRAVVRSDFPRVRAARAVATGFPLFLVLYAAAYSIVAHEFPGSFTEALNRTDALYFTVTVFATVGFGDIAPTTDLTRILVTTQMVLGLVVVGLVARILLGAVERAEDGDGPRTSDGGPAADPPSGRRGGG